MLEELTLTQLRKIIRDYNLHTSIKVPGGVSKASKEDLIKHIHKHMTLDKGELVIKPIFEPLLLPISKSRKILNKSIKNEYFDRLDKQKMRAYTKKQEEEEKQARENTRLQERLNIEARRMARDKKNLLDEQKYLIENWQDKNFKNPGKQIMKDKDQLKKIMDSLKQTDMLDVSDNKLSYADMLKNAMPSVKKQEKLRNYKQIEFKPSFKNIVKKGELLKDPFIFDEFYVEPVKKLSASDFSRIKKDFGKNILKKDLMKLKPSDFTRSKNKFVDTAIDVEKMKDLKKWIDKETDKYNYIDIKELEPQAAKPWDYDQLIEYKRKLNKLKRQIKKNK